jgi:aspartate aminotransferase-like enzyme
MIAHGGPDLAALRLPLKSLFRTQQDVIVGTSSATGFMEAAIRCGVEDRVLVVIGGTDGERFAQVAESCGKEVVRVMVHPGRTLEPEHLDQFLDGPEVDAVALVHSETSTGALAPLAELTPVIRARKHTMILVDAASSIGGCPVETDAWGLDFVFTGSEKALALPPGLALGAASHALLEKARRIGGRGRYFDLVRLSDETVDHPATPALPQYIALAAQLGRIEEEGGIEARWKRHHEMLTVVEEWVLVHPKIRLLAVEGRRSWTVSCLELPDGVASSSVVRAMDALGWAIAQGHGALKEKTIRIGHMGDVGPEKVYPLLASLDQALKPNVTTS